MAREGKETLPTETSSTSSKSRSNSTKNGKSAAEYRTEMVELLKSGLAFNLAPIERAFLAVPRENFLPSNLSLEKIYADEAIVVKYNEEGAAISSSTQPYLMADMLEALHLEAGMRVLEIGAGVGYNAAIMAQIVGDGALVTTLDLDPEMADIARDNLQRLGSPYSEVTVLAADGAAGWPAHAPYDRIIVTVQQWDISPAWVEQLKIGGLLLLPITISNQLWGGLIPSLRKEANGTLTAIDASYGGFMPMRGEMLHPMLQKATHTQFLEQQLQTTLPPEQILPTYYQSAGAVIYLSGTDFSDKYGRFFKEEVPQHSLGLLSREELFPGGAEAESNAKVCERSSREWARLGAEQRAALNMAQGFNILVAAATESNICSLMVSTPTKEKSTELDSMRLEWRGLVVFFPTDDGAALDMAFLIATSPVLGWRAGKSPQEGNRALEHVASMWQQWKERGYPQPASYRPIAFPSHRFPPVPGVLVTRPHYSLVLE